MKTTSFLFRRSAWVFALLVQLAVDSAFSNTLFAPARYHYYQINPFEASEALGGNCYKDKQPPVAQLKMLGETECTSLQGAPWSDFLILSDNCTPNEQLYVTYKDSTYLNCEEQVILVFRKWKIKDLAGNTTVIDQTIPVQKIQLKQIELPLDVKVYCPELPDAAALGEAVPTYQGKPVSHFCGYTVDYKDKAAVICGNSTLITRHWTITDCCNSYAIDHEQQIYYLDTTRPVLTCPAPMVFKTNVKECYSHQRIPGIAATDGCSPLGIKIQVVVDNGKTYKVGDLVILSAGNHTFEYKVTDACGNLSTCTVPVTVVDGQGPLLSCKAIEVCLITDSIRVGPEQLVDEYWDDCQGLKKVSLKIRKFVDLCGDPKDDLVFKDSVTICCAGGEDVVRVEIQATDAAGNVSYCRSDIYVTSKLNVDIECLDTVEVDCGEPLPEIIPEVIACGDYDLDTKIIFDNRDAFGIGTVIIRYIVTTAGGMQDSCQTVFEVGLEGNPFGPEDVICPPGTVSIAGCTFPDIAGIPGISLTDTVRPCSQVNVNLQLDTFTDLGIPCLRITRTWTVTDVLQPGLQVICVQNIDVIDTIAPVLSGARDTTVVAGLNCTAIVDLPEVIATDCDTGIVVTNTFNAQGGNLDSIVFPLGQTRITFWGVDACGNRDSLSILITVIDTSGFGIVCQNDTIVNCGTVFVPRPAVIEASCTQVATNVLTSDTVRNKCDITHIHFKRVVTDTLGRKDSCTFTVTFRASDTLFCNQIQWPKDTLLASCGKSIHPDSLNLKPIFTFNAGSCARVAVTYKDTSLAGGGGTCTNITRRIWTVSDTCAIPPVVCRDTQLISVVDTSRPILQVPKDTCVFLAFPALCDTLLGFLGNATAQDCDPAVIIKSVVIGKTDTGGASLVRRYGLGDTRVLVIAQDACGNRALDTVLIQVKDTVRPDAVCVKSNNYFNDQGLVRVNARTFNGGSTDNCTPPAMLRFSWTKNLADTILEVNCDVIKIIRASGDTILDSVIVMPFERNFNLWVTDASGNQDTCVGNRFLAFFDTLNLCGKNAIKNLSSITGKISMENGLAVPKVILSAIGDEQYQHLSDEQGTYMFDKINPGIYKMFPYKNDDTRSGISTADLIAIQRHILGEKILNPTQQIAADINKDEVVTTLDLIELRKVIVGIYEVFPQNTSWRFFDQSLMEKMDDHSAMKEMENPFVEAAEKETSQLNFMAVKIGDVNGSTVPQFAALESREQTTRWLNIPAWNLNEGEQVELPLSLNLDDLVALQASIFFEDLDILGIKEEPGALIKPYFVATNQLGKGYFNFSWIKSGPAFPAQATHLVSLVLRARRDLALSEKVTLVHKSLAPEAYHQGGYVSAIQLRFEPMQTGKILDRGIVLNQNIPNPFTGSTRIRFSLPEAGETKWTFMDITGRVIRSWSLPFDRGSHEMVVDKAGLGTSGVLYYRLDFKGYTETRKMILLD